MKRALIITYYWPPSGGSAVLRWLKFAKYLRNFGWEPVIYTPANPEPQETDLSLLKDIPLNLEVITSPIWEPYTIYKWLTGRKKEDRLGVALMTDKKNGGLISRFSLWIRSNLFIPDPRRFWVNPSIRLLGDYIRSNPVDVVISTGPPHSMHLIGLGLKKKLGSKWIADFRDPWTHIDFYKDLALTRLADRYHKMLEKKVLEEADQVITISPGMTREYLSMGIHPVTTITNGYDEESFVTAKPDESKFTLIHLGSMPKSRNPEILWKALSELVNQNHRFASMLHIRLIGKADLLVKESIENNHLQHYVSTEEYVPHEQTPEILTRATVLLLCINNTPHAAGILTNKFFEYLSARRPILALGPTDGDAAAILNQTGAGRIFDYSDYSGLKNHLSGLIELNSQNDLKSEFKDIERYSRKNLTKELSELLNKLID